MVHNFKVYGWENHPEILSLREKIRSRKVSAEEIEEIKSEIRDQRKVVPVVRDLSPDYKRPLRSTERFGTR